MLDKTCDISEELLDWYERHGRHHLPWQIDKTPYRVWLSEIMLQQTQVGTVIPYYHRFLESFPSIKALANTDIDRVLQHWQGLGYYARARNMHKAAKIIRDQYDSNFPEDMEAVMALPGIGRSTAAAILTFACNQSWPILDGNVKRVLVRCFEVEGWYGQSDTMKRLWQLSESVTPALKTDDFNQAMMDLGSMVCLKSKPLCQQCPLSKFCFSYRNNTQSQYPQKKPSKAKPLKQTLMLLHRHKEQVLLIRRPPTGIWGGLWSLPEVESEIKIKGWQEKNLSAQSPLLSVSENVIRHQFTHFSLDISVANFELLKLVEIISDNGDMKFVEIKDLSKFGLPTPVQKILKQL